MPPQPTPQLPQGQGNSDALLPLFQALAQAMAQQGRLGQGRLSLQGAQTFGRHLGMGGAEITPDNPTGNSANPWDANGAFHGGLAAQLYPEARQATQGNSAMTQWAKQGQVPGIDPDELARVQGKMTPQPKNYGIPSVDQFSDPQFIRRQQQNPYSTMFQGSGSPQPGFGMGVQPQGPRKGSSFNFMGGGSPRPGFGFGAQ